MTDKSQKIVKFKAQNMMRLEVVEITPDGNLVVIGGRNAQGKSSVLDSIAMAIGGGGEIPGEPIRRGEKKAEVFLELEDLIVVRKFANGKASKLEVTAKDGAKMQSPQKVLDALMGGLKKKRLTFDPLEFVRAARKEQLDILKQIVDVDLDSLDKKRRGIFDQRTEVNREMKRLQGAMEEAPYTKDAPAEEISVSQLIHHLEDARRTNRQNDTERDELRTAEQEHEASVASLEEARRNVTRLEEARRNVTRLEGSVGALATEIKSRRDICESLEDIDLAPIDEKIASAEDDNRKARENAEYNRLAAAVDEKDDEWADLDMRINQIDEEKRMTLAAAPFPVDGLGFISDEGISFQDLPFDQASQAEQLRVAVAIGLAMNPELRVLLIRDGSLLDADSLKQLADLAKESDAQLWVERVGEGEECTVVIEDGQVKS